jgi:uncharacterized alkaline shock family protein YloU
MKDKAAAPKKSENGEITCKCNETGGELGLVRIHENVLATIVRKATCSVKGIVKLAGSAFVDNLAEIVGSRKIHDRAISIDMGGESLLIEVKVNCLYGEHIPTVATSVQKAISEEVEKLTGLAVGKVNISVQELNEAEKEESGEEK